VELLWKVTRADVQRVRRFVALYKNDPLVVERRGRNLATSKPKVTRAAFWQMLVTCLLTTQQKSGPNGAVSRFVGKKPFPLSYRRCRGVRLLSPLVRRTLSRFGGIRRSTTIGEELEVNLSRLEDGLWGDVLALLNALRPAASAEAEASAAQFLVEHFTGIGPKQSRNLLQMAGLSRYEVPIDSRVVRWLNAFGFPVCISAAPLSDPSYYAFVSKGIQELCRNAKIVPCVLDAAVFASVDRPRTALEDA
jgi:hypothetical protein